MLTYVVTLLVLFKFASAAAITKRQTITGLSSAQIESFKPYTYYAAAAYSPPSEIMSWTCGGRCQVDHSLKCNSFRQLPSKLRGEPHLSASRLWW
jgi:hypothetical protein